MTFPLPQAVLRGLICAALCCLATGASAQPPRQVTAPPADWQLDPFYKKHVSVDGFPIVASAKVADHALLEAAYLVEQMLAHRPDVRDELIKQRVRFSIMAVDEMTTAIPEHRDLRPSKYWDRRARGLGATPVRPAASCGEENLLGYPGDPYAAENILIHELAHAIHQMSVNYLDPTFDDRLKQTYHQAMAQGLWKGKYAATAHTEYFAEGVQSWFDTNRPPDHDHNHVDTREELKEYDPGLAKIVEEIFGDHEWRYVRPDQRKVKPSHLADYDPPQAPHFAWDPDLLAWYERYEAEKAAREKQRHEASSPTAEQ